MIPLAHPATYTPLAKKVLVVDDDQSLLNFLKEGLKLHGYKATTCNSGPKALKNFLGNKFNFIVLDYLMPDLNGRRLYELMRETRPNLATPLIVITGAPFDKELVNFLTSSNAYFLTKPFCLEVLTEAMDWLGKRTEEKTISPKFP